MSLRLARMDDTGPGGSSSSSSAANIGVQGADEDGEVSNDDDEESISSMSSSEERDLMVSSTELQDSEPLHFSTIDGDDNTEGVDLTTISGGLPRIYHHTQIGQCLVDVLHDLMSEGKASLEDKEVALNILEEEFQLAFKNLYPGVLDSNSKGRGKGSKKRKRKGKHNSAEQGEGLVDQDILSILRDDPLFSREDRGSSTHQLQRSDGVHAQRSQTTQMALDRGATTMYGGGAWKFTGRLDEMGSLRECQALQCSTLLRGSKAEMSSPLIQLNFDEIEVRVADRSERAAASR
ncbi:hypothetical protein Pmar_PMAR016072 [Perkinsus marinus ATCC 50983]|uniref:Uncharacterized protein n=1 Tax=Perkinsus marinus (strain ATCC 50983 / TXsc) TaxID=423536 RepID=C5LYY9_PERM5|nr:hypothetical protein Pmar_PMAR016072 [Perkinsus marinus ATCC 50983]EEQ97998.1 hypothetical protein Pmar_PMAR016072 [Perkinsus marinus ATCC 50983]|eukprot:XP_002765281.1 hypothetical protein Pmar_PMAR016072 [Perkinsus marinus ATCC 50983]